MNIEDYISVTEAAKRLGVSGRRVRAMIMAGRLKAEKFGRDWLVAKSGLRAKAVKQRRPGAPRGNKNALGNPGNTTENRGNRHVKKLPAEGD